MQEECSKFGVRPLPKKKMIAKLHEIYEYTHPLVGEHLCTSKIDTKDTLLTHNLITIDVKDSSVVVYSSVFRVLAAKTRAPGFHSLQLLAIHFPLHRINM